MPCHKQPAHLPNDFHTFLNSISTSASCSWPPLLPLAAGAAAVCCAACAGSAALITTRRCRRPLLRHGCCKSGLLGGRAGRRSGAGGAAGAAAAAGRQLPARASVGRCSAAVRMLEVCQWLQVGGRRRSATKACCLEAGPAGRARKPPASGADA